jgi:aerobic-type carbon monoxide dehydrogenase small subunit (CoxS/CutS family)
VYGPEPVPIKLRVNGQVRALSVEPRTTLASALRDELDLTGTKIGCDRGACGACTVLLDGKPALACTTLAIEVGERPVTTIEGLAKRGALHPAQQAFVTTTRPSAASARPAWSCRARR